jgi:hypothetical protein
MRRWEDNVKKDLKLDGKPWTGFIWLRMGTSDGTVVNTVMKVFDPVKCGKSLIG